MMIIFKNRIKNKIKHDASKFSIPSISSIQPASTIIKAARAMTTATIISNIIHKDFWLHIIFGQLEYFKRPQQQRCSYHQQHHHQKKQPFEPSLFNMELQRILFIGLILLNVYVQQIICADLAISIPNNQGTGDAFYRLDYSPPYGHPEPNTTIASNEIGDEIQFSHALPGTKYNFWLYYTNFTHHDWLTWTVSITTAPDPPSNLSVQVRSSKNAIISWSPPIQGNYTAFKIKVLSLTEASNSYNRTFLVNDTFQHSAKELTPGATYQVQAYTIYDGKESVAYTSRNFTTSKSHYKTKFQNTKCSY